MGLGLPGSSRKTDQRGSLHVVGVPISSALSNPGDATTQIETARSRRESLLEATDEQLRALGMVLLRRPPTPVALVDRRAGSSRPARSCLIDDSVHARRRSRLPRL
jgi:hypothetical protein